MSSNYSVYAEARIRDKWFSLNPIVKKADGTYKIIPVYWSCSAFRSVHEDMECSQLCSGIPDDLSPEVRAEFHDNLDESVGWGKQTWRDYYKYYVMAVDFDRGVCQRVNKDRPYRYMGYVRKEAYVAFECYEIDEIEHWYTPQEYEKLSPAEQKGLVYYEWNNAWDDYGIYTTIMQRVRTLMAWFEDGNVLGEDYTYADREISDSQVRLIVCGP